VWDASAGGKDAWGDRNGKWAERKWAGPLNGLDTLVGGRWPGERANIERVGGKHVGGQGLCG